MLMATYIGRDGGGKRFLITKKTGGGASFRLCGRGASPEYPRSNLAVVGLWDQLTHHTSEL